MLKPQFDRQQPYRVVTYARMSSDQQNARSPDQQQDQIKRTLQAQGLNWQIIHEYRDDGISGRYLLKRPGFQQMLTDIRSGRMAVDLILVDTTERLGRTSELAPILTELKKNYGVLVVSADSNFDDPTSAQGQIYSVFQSLRATEENRIKGHQVIRGKRDTAQRKFWPGGKPPFGYQLKPLFNDPQNPAQVTGTVLEINFVEAEVIRLMFQRALETGHGQRRLASWLNAHPEIPDQFKPFTGPSVERRLSNTIYKGVLTWGIVSVDIVDDSRVQQRNPVVEHVVVPDFCEPLVDTEVWDSIQSVRQNRRQRLRVQRELKQTEQDSKLIKAIAPQVSINHLLVGFVKCEHCNAVMRVVTSGRKSKAGKIYNYYACARHLEGGCENSKHISEEWLNKTVIEQLKRSLFEQN